MQRKTITLLALVTILVSLACNFSAPTPTPELPPITVPYPDTLVPPPPLPTNTEVIPAVTDTSQPSADTGPLVQLNWFSYKSSIHRCQLSSIYSCSGCLVFRSGRSLGDCSST